MKTSTSIILFLVLTGTLLGADLETVNGKFIKNVRLRSRNGDHVNISHDFGTGLYKISDFKKESQMWFEGRLGTRYIGSGMSFDDESYALAGSLADLFFTNMTAKVYLGERTRKLIQREKTAPRKLTAAYQKVRRIIYTNFLASELRKEELRDVVKIYTSAVMLKAEKHDHEIEPQVQALLDSYAMDHPEKLEEFEKRLEHKSRRTGLYYIELDRIETEVHTALKDELDEIYEDFFTKEEMLKIQKLDTNDSLRRLRLAWMRGELIAPGIADKYLAGHPEELKLLNEFFDAIEED